MRLKLKRDDGQVLDLSTTNGYSTEASDDWFTAKPLRNSTVNYQGYDGGELIKQNYDMWPISVSGSIHGYSLESIRERARKLSAFIAKNHYYTAIFTECDGTQMAARKVFISTALALPRRDKNDSAIKYSFQITLSDPYLYEYAEDEQGNETYANSVSVQRYVEEEGGYEYAGGGYIYYGGGYAYTGIANLPTKADIESVADIYPVWTITGPATNPTITNLSNDVSLAVNTTLSAGQTLVVDCQNRTAYIGTADMTRFVAGDWLVLNPGTNQLRYESDKDTDAKASIVSWNGVVI